MVAAAVRANVARRVAVVAAEGGVGIAVSGEGVGEAVAAAYSSPAVCLPAGLTQKSLL